MRRNYAGSVINLVKDIKHCTSCTKFSKVAKTFQKHGNMQSIVMQTGKQKLLMLISETIFPFILQIGSS